MVVLFASWGAEYGLSSGFFKCLEWEKVRYPVMLEPMPPQAVRLVEIAVVESIFGRFAFWSV